jgi:hypothetical protein
MVREPAIPVDFLVTRVFFMVIVIYLIIETLIKSSILKAWLQFMKICAKSFLLLCLSLSCMQSSTQGGILSSVGLGLTMGTGIQNAWNYAATSYLVQEKHLVKGTYPYAQMWYDYLAIKYPTAHLDQKLFLQTWRNVDAKYMQHLSWFHNIYFPQDSLETINKLYKKVTDGEQLTQEEQLSLGKEEFLLLHEAAHIEHGDVAARCLAMSGILAGLTGLAEIHTSIGTEAKAISLLKDSFDVNRTIASAIHHYGIIIIGTMLYVTMFNAFAHTHEIAADKFACDLADINALEGGITFFEDEKIDPLIDIEAESISPFIPVQSDIGAYIQSWIKTQDEQNLVNLKNVKLDPAARIIFDAQRDPVHPSPSIRAQRIRDEIARRKEL